MSDWNGRKLVLSGLMLRTHQQQQVLLLQDIMRQQQQAGRMAPTKQQDTQLLPQTPTTRRSRRLSSCL
jgi:hypothetical protein